MFQCYSGPVFISGEVVGAKGQPPMPPSGRKVPFLPYNKSKPSWPYSVITMPHEAGLLSESEKFELLYPPEVHDAPPELTSGTFEEGHLYKPAGFKPLDFEVSTRLPPAESFYCTGKGCYACKRKVEVNKK